jgi:hypothetical protein
LGKDFTGFAIFLLKMVLKIIGPFIYIPMAESGERHVFLATSARYSAGGDGSGDGSGVPLDDGLAVARGIDGMQGSMRLGDGPLQPLPQDDVDIKQPVPLQYDSTKSLKTEISLATVFFNFLNLGLHGGADNELVDFVILILPWTGLPMADRPNGPKSAPPLRSSHVYKVAWV